MRRICMEVICLWCLSLLFMPAAANATLGDSDVVLETAGISKVPDNCYTPGETTTVCFEVTNRTIDSEEIDEVNFLFPTGWGLAFVDQSDTGVLDIHTITDNYAEFSE